MDLEGNEALVVIQALLDELDDIQVDLEHPDSRTQIPWREPDFEAQIQNLLRKLRGKPYALLNI